ncbi:MAG: response regulator [Lachnospiraceae bacterium]|nr:response regulator [Lachnospiraceae bacterium]
MEKILPNILIVDDDIQTIKIMSLYLEETANVFSVLGGIQALDFLKQHSVDMILLDVEMPDMNGFQTLEQIRKIKECSHIPVILVTGHRDRYASLNIRILGIEGYLLKPVSKEVLNCRISEIYQKNTETSHRKTILLIDDDMAYLKQLNSLLKDSYHVIMINSGKLALNYLLKHTPDLILLDYQMPGYNGSDFMREIQEKYPDKQIPVILMTGTLTQEILNGFDTYIPVACLQKPVNKETLFEHIENVFKP